MLSQLASPGAENLFHKAIIQSGSYHPDQRTLVAAEALGANFSDSLGCNVQGEVLDCLRALTVTQILAAQPTTYIPNNQTDILPVSIQDAINSGDFNQVPVIEGTNLNEGRLFVAAAYPFTALGNEEDYRADVATTLSGSAFLDADTIATDYLEKYTDSPHKYSFALAAIQTDAGWACEALTQTAALDQYVDVYSYHFTDVNAPALFPASFPLGATHAFEIQYVMGSEQDMLNRGAGAAQINLSNAMLAYWASFAKTGNPNPAPGNLIQWPALDTGHMLELNETISSKALSEFDTTHQCSAYWANPPLSS